MKKAASLTWPARNASVITRAATFDQHMRDLQRAECGHDIRELLPAKNEGAILMLVGEEMRPARQFPRARDDHAPGLHLALATGQADGELRVIRAHRFRADENRVRFPAQFVRGHARLAEVSQRSSPGGVVMRPSSDSAIFATTRRLLHNPPIEIAIERSRFIRQ